jgi:hypothetical protein
LQILKATLWPNFINWTRQNYYLVVAGALVLGLGSFRGLIFWSCPIYKFSGIYCPGCGATRAVGEILQGNVVAAFEHNALFMSAPLLIMIANMLKRKDNKSPKIFLLITFALTLGFTIARNIPNSIFAPF